MTTPEGQQQNGDVAAAAAAATGQQQGGQPANQQTQNGGQGQGSGGKQDDNTPKFTQADYNRFEAQIRREYASKAERDKDLIEKGKEYEGLLAESRPLSERVETLSGVVAERDQTIATKDLTITRMQLAWEAGLPPALGERVQGNTVDEIKADIEKLKGFTTAQQQQQQGPGIRPNPQQGVPSQGDPNRTGSVDAGRDLWAKRHGKKTDAAV